MSNVMLLPFSIVVFDVITFDVTGCFEVAFLDSETSTKKCKTCGRHTFQIRKFQFVLSYIFQRKFSL